MLWSDMRAMRLRSLCQCRLFWHTGSHVNFRLAEEADISKISFLMEKHRVTVEYEDGKPVRLESVVVSCQHGAEKSLKKLDAEIREKVLRSALRLLPPDEDTKILINPSGKFVCGGFDADTGLTGRKLMVDSYGSMIPHGGGAFSGKDCSKVDRSAAYMARYIAKNIVAAGLASKCQVSLAYAIGVAQPVMIEVDTFGTGNVCADDCLAAVIPLVFWSDTRSDHGIPSIESSDFPSDGSFWSFWKKGVSLGADR